MLHTPRIAFLASTVAVTIAGCASGPSLESVSAAGGGVVPPGEAAQLRMTFICEGLVVDGNAVPVSRKSRPRVTGGEGRAYDVILPVGRRVIAFVPRFGDFYACSASRPDTTPVRFDVRAGHRYQVFAGPPALVRVGGLRFAEGNRCIIDRTARDTVCAFESPHPGADSALLTITWTGSLVVDAIDGTPVRAAFLGYGGFQQTRIALAAGRHSVAVRNYTTASLPQPGAVVLRHSVAGMPCQLVFDVEAGREYHLGALYVAAPRRGIARADLSRLLAWAAYVSTEPVARLATRDSLGNNVDMRGRIISGLASCSRLPDNSPAPPR